MLTLAVVGVISGAITAVSPCVLPVLPAILTSSMQDGGANRRRPFVVVGGLVASFAVFTLVGGALISLLNVPSDFLRWLGIVTLLVVGLGLAVPAVGHVLERPFVNTRLPQLNRNGNGFVMGLALGLVFVPCAGPILAAITVLAATAGVSWGLVVLTASFSVGLAIPLLAFGLAGQEMGVRIKAVRNNLRAVRIASGVVLMTTALVVAANIAEPLQRAVPGAFLAVQERLEDSEAVRTQLDALDQRDRFADNEYGRYKALDECSYLPTELHNCGEQPEITGITSWLNTPNGEALSSSDLRGKVVLIDFWTYSCINCQRTFPYLTAWWDEYRDDGLLIIGVHSPEFEFEKVERNVSAATERYGITYPVALDNNYATWDEWNQRYWPARYLVDQNGTVVHVHYGEGDYQETEMLIQQLLDSPPAPLVAPGDYDLTYNRSPERYVGYELGLYPQRESLVRDVAKEYTAAEIPRGNYFSLGGTWTVRREYAEAGEDAHMVINFYAAQANLVLGGSGTVTVEVAGDPSTRRSFTVSGEPDRYTLWTGDEQAVLLNIEFTPGLQAYAFTFG